MARFPKIKISKKMLKKGGLAISGLLILILLVFGVYSVSYGKKTYLRQTAGGVSVSGKTQAEVQTILTDRASAYLSEPITLVYAGNGKTYTIAPSDIGLSFDIDQTAADVWSFGRGDDALVSLGQQILSIFKTTNHPLVFVCNESGLKQNIANIASELDQPEKDFTLAYSNGKFELLSDRTSGQRIDQNAIKNKIDQSIKNLNGAEITFDIKSYAPQIDENKAKQRLVEANTILAGGELTLKNGSQTFTADADTIGALIVSKGDGNDLKLILNQNRAQKFVSSIADNINIVPKDAKLTIVNGKVTVFQNSQDGKTLDQVQTISDIQNALFSRIQSGTTSVDPKTVTLKVAVAKANVSTSDINTLGINELIGTATTDFRNSPSNRVHNITIGANSLNGVLLASGEEFSTLSHLGTIDASSGYLQELVIKNNKTVPDFGGGLCQVSSTLFRAALNAGMKITERLNHSYRVSYYEPPIGMDATIFDPSPDFKFVNNYASHVLIQSKIVGTKITFEFYGTKDGRKIEISTPNAYNYVNPPAPVYTETDTLAPGETKLVSHPHQGASANFHYKVSDASGTVLQDKTFTSVYVALPEQWLIGKAAAIPAPTPVPIPAPTPAPAPTPTCTDATQNGDETGIDCGGSCPTACPTT